MPYDKEPKRPNLHDKRVQAALEAAGAPVGHCGKHRVWMRAADGEPECECPWPQVIERLARRIALMEEEHIDARRELSNLRKTKPPQPEGVAYILLRSIYAKIRKVK